MIENDFIYNDIFNYKIDLDIVIASKLEFKRNFFDYKYINRMSNNEFKDLIINFENLIYNIKDIYYNIKPDDSKIKLLIDNYLISKEQSIKIYKHKDKVRFYLSKKNNTLFILNYQEHFCLNSFYLGYNNFIYEFNLDKEISKINYSYSEEHKYLMSKIVNINNNQNIKMILFTPFILNKVENGDIDNFLKINSDVFAYRYIFHSVSILNNDFIKDKLNYNSYMLIKINKTDKDYINKIIKYIKSLERDLAYEFYNDNRLYLEDTYYKSKAILSNAILLNYNDFLFYFKYLLIGLFYIENKEKINNTSLNSLLFLNDSRLKDKFKDKDIFTDNLRALIVKSSSLY